MGQDLAKKAVPTFIKAWDRERAALKAGDLLTQTPDAPKPAFLMDLDPDLASLAPGQLVQLNCSGATPVVERDLVPIGKVIDPPTQIADLIAAGTRYLSAEIVSVHAEAGVAEVVLK